ncbi:MAG TPA: STAS domain-containing protein [Xanthomonadaceae bacterium]|nr:STAS domain-containing protein [Xanthomonadaceae bacterium]
MTIIECQSELDIAMVGALHRQLLDTLQARQPLEIDGRAVRKIHTAALQLFLGALAEIQLLGLQFRWREPSPALVEGARLLGLADSLGLNTPGNS